jgi:hypothetical protein
MRGPLKFRVLLDGLLVLALVVPAASSAAGQRPLLALVNDDPVVVSGRGFVSRERITLRATVGGAQFSKRVFASRFGRFTAEVADADATCSPFVITARGRTGTTATLKRINIPAPCGVVIQP